MQMPTERLVFVHPHSKKRNALMPSTKRHLARIGALAVAVLLAACSDGGSRSVEQKAKLVRKPPGPPVVAATVTLPNNDGRVHVIQLPGRSDVSKCLVFVGAAGSSMTCLHDTEYARPEYELEPLPRDEGADVRVR